MSTLNVALDVTTIRPRFRPHILEVLYREHRDCFARSPVPLPHPGSAMPRHWSTTFASFLERQPEAYDVKASSSARSKTPEALLAEAAARGAAAAAPWN